MFSGILISTVYSFSAVAVLVVVVVVVVVEVEVVVVGFVSVSSFIKVLNSAYY